MFGRRFRLGTRILDDQTASLFLCACLCCLCFLPWHGFLESWTAGLILHQALNLPELSLVFKMVLWRSARKPPSSEGLEAWPEVHLCRTPQLVTGLGPHWPSSILNRWASSTLHSRAGFMLVPFTGKSELGPYTCHLVHSKRWVVFFPLFLKGLLQLGFPRC